MRRFTGVVLTLALIGCQPEDRDTAPAPSAVDNAGNTAATRFTEAANREVSEALPLSDEQDFADAKRGLIGSDPQLRVFTEDGREIWAMPAYDFVDGEAPASVNPSLWRQAKLNG